MACGVDRGIFRAVQLFSDPKGAIFRLIVMVLSLSVHEWAHARTAMALGDDTPRRQGRDTLNPMAHVDLIGTIILPLFAPIGWAKPVQWNPRNIRPGVPMRRALWLVSLAGPASNVVLSLISMVLYLLVARFAEHLGGPAYPILETFFIVNVSLAVFNMVPIPPLDGSRIVDANIPRGFEATWAQVHEHSSLIFLAFIILMQQVNLLGPVISGLSQLLFRIAARLTGVEV